MPPKKKPGSAQKGALKKSGSGRIQVELMMECEDEELSPAQLKALQKAQEDHDKANDLIKAARAGNTLVPSTKPNTFTLVPPKQPQAPPQVPPTPPTLAVPSSKNQSPANLAPASKLQGFKQPAIQQLTPQVSTIQKQLSEPAIQTPPGPPPRPQQYLNKHQQKKEDTSPDIMIIGESPPRPNSKILMNQNVQSHQIPVQSAKVAGVTPTQVYKFVSPHGTATQIGGGAQWLIRPVLTVTPQQLQQQQGKQQVQQQQAATSSNKFYMTTPPTGSNTKPAEESAAAKKKSKKENLLEIDSAGHWVPLDEYYYGTVEGDPTYTEEKGEYRFKCWYCSKMLYNNVRAMQHIQAHIDSTKQLNIDLSDLTQCKHCYKQFDTPFEMQTHVEKIHLSNKVLMCRICERGFGNTKDLIMHMRQHHLPCEMPYHCQLCGFRSSMYSDVVDHFKKKHDASSNMLCLYCLRVFRIKFVSQGWGQTQTYYGHLLKHQAKSSMKKCNVCRLMFFNPLDVKTHRKNCHTSYKMDFKAMTMGQAADDQLMIKVTEGGPKGNSGSRKESKPKSLNAPSISKIQDYGGVSLPFATTTSRCIECKMTMSSTDHYKKHINCSLCRFATSCSVAYANHMMGFHSGQVASLNLNIPWERPMKQVMFCSCGFSTKYGTKMANHLVFCGKHTCSGERPKIANTAGEKAKDDNKKEGGIFGALGLVQKKPVTTRVRALDSGKSEPKSDWKMDKQSGQESKQTSLKPKTSPSASVIEVDDFKSSALRVDKSKLDAKKEGQGNLQNVKEDKGNIEKGAIEGSKNNAGNQLEMKDRGLNVDNSTDDVERENSHEQDKVEAADVTVEKSDNKNKVEAIDIKEESDDLLNKDKLVEKVDTGLDANESNKSVDDHDEAQNTKQTIPEAIQLDSDTEEDNVEGKQLIDKPEGTNKIDVEVKQPSDRLNDDTKESDVPEAKQLDTDTEGDAETEQPSDKLDNTEETDGKTKQVSDETEEQVEDDIILLEEDMDEEDKSCDLNTKTQKASQDITDVEMTDRDADTVAETETTETGDKTPHGENTEVIETDQLDEKDKSQYEQQGVNEENTAEREVVSIETEDKEMMDTVDKEQEEPKEPEVVSQVKGTDPNAIVRSDVEDNCRDVGEQEGDITAGDIKAATPTDVELTEVSKDVCTEDHPDEPEAKTEDPEVNLEEDKSDETKQETSQIERPRQSSVDSQKSDRSDRSSQGQQEHRSYPSGGHTHDERHRHGDRSYDRSHDRHQRDYHSGTYRSDDYRPYNRDRDRSHDRGYDESRDNRYGYDNNRSGHGQNYRGHRGQYGGHHYGNRGGYNQDRNYNRNYGNRGGYGGGYRGGYY